MQSSTEDTDSPNNQTAAKQQVSDKVFTVPNLISFIRLCLVPVFFVLLLQGQDIVATLLFACAAGTDWIDGQVARRTNTVSKFGQIFDPVVDRALLISGVVALLIIGRIPLWIVIFLVARDGFMLFGGAYLLKKYAIRIPVVYLGKATTAVLLFGFMGLLLNWPLVFGLGLIDFFWLPGWGSAPTAWGIWFVYIGLLLSFVTGVYYFHTAKRKIAIAKARSEGHNT